MEQTALEIIKSLTQEKREKRLLWILIGAAAVLSGIAAFLFFWSRKNKKEEEEIEDEWNEEWDAEDTEESPAEEATAEEENEAEEPAESGVEEKRSCRT